MKDNVINYNFKKGKTEGCFILVDKQNRILINKVFYSGEDVYAFVKMVYYKKIVRQRILTNRELDINDRPELYSIDFNPENFSFRIYNVENGLIGYLKAIKLEDTMDIEPEYYTYEEFKKELEKNE